MITVKDILDQKGHTAWTIGPEAKVFEALESHGQERHRRPGRRR